jgi:hypothetical protein
MATLSQDCKSNSQTSVLFNALQTNVLAANNAKVAGTLISYDVGASHNVTVGNDLVVSGTTTAPTVISDYVTVNRDLVVNPAPGDGTITAPISVNLTQTGGGNLSAVGTLTITGNKAYVTFTGDTTALTTQVVVTRAGLSVAERLASAPLAYIVSTYLSTSQTSLYFLAPGAGTNPGLLNVTYDPATGVWDFIFGQSQGSNLSGKTFIIVFY